MGEESGKKPAKRIGLAIAVALVVAIVLVVAYVRTVARSHAPEQGAQAQAR